MGRAVAQRPYGVDRAQPEVVVEVRGDREAGEGPYERRDVGVHGLGGEHSAGVGEAQPGAAGVATGPGPFEQVVRAGAAGVLAGELDGSEAELGGVGQVVGDEVEVGLAVPLDGPAEPVVLGCALVLQQGAPQLVLQVQVGGGGEDQHAHRGQVGARLAGRLRRDGDVVPGGPRDRHDLQVAAEPSAVPGLQDAAQGLAVGLARRGEGRHEHVHAHVAEQSGEFELLVGAEGDPRHLLAVAERLVVDVDALREVLALGELDGLPYQVVEGFPQLDHAVSSARLCRGLFTRFGRVRGTGRAARPSAGTSRCCR